MGWTDLGPEDLGRDLRGETERQVRKCLGPGAGHGAFPGFEFLGLLNIQPRPPLHTHLWVAWVLDTQAHLPVNRLLGKPSPEASAKPSAQKVQVGCAQSQAPGKAWRAMGVTVPSPLLTDAHCKPRGCPGTASLLQASCEMV